MPYRGFFDTHYYSKINDFSFINIQVCATLFLHYLSLIYFQSKHSRKLESNNSNHIANNKRYAIIIFLLGLTLVFIAIIARLKLSTMIDLSEIIRVREMPAGSAKLIFMNTWFSFGMFFIFYSLNMFYNKIPQYLLIAIFIVFSIAIVGNISWRGGRVVALLYSFPLLFLLFHIKPKMKLPLSIISSVMMFFYVSAITFIRKQGYAVESTPLSQILDWEIGRFSMVGYGIDYVDRFDFSYGYTIYDAILRIFASPLYFTGLGAEFVGGKEGTLIGMVGLDIFGSDEVTYVVPGILSEFYINFGIFGVVFLSYLISKISTYLDWKLENKINKPFEYLIYAYIGALLLLNFYNATFLSFLNYLFFNGLPIWIGLLLLKLHSIYKRKIFI
ncbi:hypothetical protein CWB63_15665 [Pseudoalteromonas sp. S409]|nr:hypothetical protein CWB64_12135 [Pseudoalteromonas sp. S410]TMN89294.1 hypothetical protein CWB62_13125 [Pseudoalteromonas sp. S408]TMN95072.1 hypothetical protein CWB61_16020 [Pseudoalteromonas sp. S407]TMN96539.1 hypothetical protein CWB63_15665 [Pseudoalteromonas sp. S409]TMO07794.1 hypothetical protein CWB57_15335 [Pseudoalteromonas sp. S186]TMO13793.1 hypothetical protein CWB56_15185 [Pseudoalteromonas sp. S185]